MKRIVKKELIIIFLCSNNFFTKISDSRTVNNSSSNSNYIKQSSNSTTINKKFNLNKNYSAFYFDLLNNVKAYIETIDKKNFVQKNIAYTINTINSYVDNTATSLSSKYNISQNSTFYYKTIESVKKTALSIISNSSSESPEKEKNADETTKELISKAIEKINESEEDNIAIEPQYEN
jgi:hypothetical protein